MSEDPSKHPPEVAAEEFIIPTRREFLECLALDRPELNAVKDALSRDDVAAAEQAFIRHFRVRDMTTPLLPDWRTIERDVNHDVTQAAGLLEGRLYDHYNVEDVGDGKVDWHESSLACLTRFPIFKDLIDAAHHTGDPRYIRYIVGHGSEYMVGWPLESFVGQRSDRGWVHHYIVGPAWWWCMHPNRLEEWSRAVEMIRRSEHVTDEELLAIVHRMLQEVRWLMTQVPYWVEMRHNVAGFMIRVIGILCTVLADFSEADEWARRDADWLAEYLDDGFYPDGMYKELTLGYSSSVVEQQSQIAYALREQPAVIARRDLLERMNIGMIGIAKPTGRVRSFGDARGRPIGAMLRPDMLRWLGTDWLSQLADDLASNPRTGATPHYVDADFPWFRDRADDPGPTPPFINWPDPADDAWGGYYAMRSDWSKHARFMMIDGGPWGTTHQHMDKLSFCLTAYNADFVVDPNNTLYANNEPDARLSTLHVGFMHSTITVDGVDEFVGGWDELATDTPLTNRWEVGDNWVLFEGSFGFAPLKPVTWRRRVLFVDRSYWLIQDVLTADDDATAAIDIEQNFQLGLDINAELRDENGSTSAVANASNGARLLMRPLASPLGAGTATVAVGDDTPRQTYSTQYSVFSKPRDFGHGRGWVSPVTKKIMPAPAVTWAGRVEVPAMITLAVVPFAPDDSEAAPPPVSVREQGDDQVITAPTRNGALTWRTSVASCDAPA